MSTKKTKATRCKGQIEKAWKGHASVLSRRQCKVMTRHPSGYCAVHRPTRWEEFTDAEEP